MGMSADRINLTQAAAMCGTTTKTLRKLLRKDGAPAGVKAGRSVLFPSKAIKAFWQKCQGGQFVDAEDERQPGELAAATYELFNQQQNDNQVVVTLKMLPAHVKELRRSWIEGGGEYRVLRRSVIAEVEADILRHVGMQLQHATLEDCEQAYLKVLRYLLEKMAHEDKMFTGMSDYMNSVFDENNAATDRELASAEAKFQEVEKRNNIMELEIQSLRGRLATHAEQRSGKEDVVAPVA